MATESSQRYYRAPCPGCGAPVEFRSAQSTHAVCGFCQSTVVRDGETLSRIGKMAELFDDHSPLQLMASGTFEGKPFTLIGRLQYKSQAGVWTEWNAILPDGTTASLSEDNGAYVFTQPLDLQRAIPPADQLRVGATTAINGKPFTVAFNDSVALISAQGELPKLPPLGRPFSAVELRSAEGEVVSLDYGEDGLSTTIARGKTVLLDDLKLTGLREEADKEYKARQFSCPNCGAPVEVALENSKSITCRSCNSIIDLSQGIGSELRHAIQDEPVRPQIPLGSLGNLQGVQWQVVGFQHRMGTAPGDDEQFGWTEYLLFNRKRGFIFLVDSEEGWSVVKPTTGAPELSAAGRTATYLGTRYELKYTYLAETNYVAGEFYWQVSRGQKTSNSDFTSAKGVLSMEQTPGEITWSSGDKISSDTVATAFKLDDQKGALRRGDASPLSASSGIGVGTIVVLFIVIVVILLLLSTCSGSSGSGYGSGYGGRSMGGSYGGSSSGGSHK